MRRRGRPPAPGRASLAVLILGIALVLGGLLVFPLLSPHSAGRLSLLVLAMFGLLLAAFAGGPRLVLACARALGRRGGVEALLAARRLRADPRSVGRVAGVLVVCGVALGIEGLLVPGIFPAGDSRRTPRSSSAATGWLRSWCSSRPRSRC